MAQTGEFTSRRLFRHFLIFSGAFARLLQRSCWPPSTSHFESAEQALFEHVGFGAITTFIMLLFAQHGWGQAWLAFTVVSVTFMAGRLIFGHLPDRIGGARVALICVLIEAAGQALIWLAPWPTLAFLGAAVTGFGSRSCRARLLLDR